MAANNDTLNRLDAPTGTGGGGSGTQYADGAARGTATGTLLMGDDGTNIQSVSTLSDGGAITALSVAQSATNFAFSTGNSSTAQLAAAATFTGTIENIINQQAVSMLLTSDQPGLLTLNQYIDAAGLRVASSVVYTITAGQGFSRSFVANGNYFNLTFKNNGGSTTTTLNINVYYGTLPPATNLSNNPVSINEINGTTISAGQQTMAISLPVAIASDQSNVPIKNGSPTTTAASTTVSVTGDNNVIAAVAGKQIKLLWYNIQAKGSNAASATAILKGTIGGVSTQINIGDYAASQPFAHSIGAGQKSIIFDTNTPVVLNLLSSTNPVYFNGEFDLI